MVAGESCHETRWFPVLQFDAEHHCWFFVLCADVVGWWAVMEKVDKGCSEFCITVGTATRTVGVLMQSRLNALAVNLNHPSGHLWLYAGLIGFDNPCWLKADLVACVNPSSSSWVWVGECFFWYRLTQVVPDTHTHPFNIPLSVTTWVSRYQKGKTNLDFTGARDSEWQWNPLGHMQVCTSHQTDNQASTPPLSFFTGRMPFLPPNQQRQSTEGKR